MSIHKFIDFFIQEDRFRYSNELRKARLFVRGSLLTSLFSTSYIWLSIVFQFDKGVYLMIMNMVGFIVLALLVKTKISISVLGNIFVFLGAAAVIILTYFSGGVWSAIYPWIVSIPVLAILLVNRSSGWFWSFIAFIAMIWFAYGALIGIEYPKEYNQETFVEWYVTVVPGLLLIIVFMAFVFESIQSKALSESQQLLEEKDYIIKVLSHDLRNPLANIQSLIHLLENDNNKEDQSTYSMMIRRAVTQAQQLVNKVLELNKADQNEIRVSKEILNIKDLIQEVVKSFEDVAKQKSIEILTEFNSDINAIDSDKTFIRLVMENLISNALKFSENQTQIVITLNNTSNNFLTISVKDQGPGIRPEEEEHLFQKFTKLTSRPTAGESSTGLGLSLVKKYMELLNGTVRYEGKYGEGATFIVELPLD